MGGERNTGVREWGEIRKNTIKNEILNININNNNNNNNISVNFGVYRLQYVKA